MHDLEATVAKRVRYSNREIAEFRERDRQRRLNGDVKRAKKAAARRPKDPVAKRAFRDRLARAATPAERLLRAALTSASVRFDFQPIISGFVPDFRLYPARVLVELDGAVHWSHKRAVRDAKRDDILRARGWRIVRILNESVMDNAVRVASRLERLAMEDRGRLPN